MIDLTREAQLQARIDELEQRNKQLLDYAEKLDSHEAKLQQRIDQLVELREEIRAIAKNTKFGKCDLLDTANAIIDLCETDYIENEKTKSED